MSAKLYEYCSVTEDAKGQLVLDKGGAKPQTLPTHTLVDGLNELGRQGFAVVAGTSNKNGEHVYVLMRKKHSKDREHDRAKDQIRG